MTQPPRDYGDLRFLVADDRSFIRTLVNGILLQEGARNIARAVSGQDAIKVLQKGGGRYDCIISDWNMEPINGLQLLQMIRAGQVPHISPDVCFVLLTGTADSTVVNTAIVLDVNAYVVKPVAREKLVKAINNGFSRVWKLKSPKYYLAISDVETPAKIKALVERNVPWVVWPKDSLKRRRAEERIQIMRQEALHASHTTALDKIKNQSQRDLAEIQPGTLLAQDIRDPEGELLIAAGVRLSQNMLARLRELALDSGEQVKLWVGEA